MSRTASKATVRSLLRLLQTPSLEPHLQAKAVAMEQTATATATATTKSSRYNAIQSYVLESIREGMKNKNSSSSKNSNSNPRLVLQRFHELQKDLHARAELYAIDTGAENQLDAREMSRRAAARAGLQLPILRDVEEDLRRDDENKKQ